MGYQMVVGRKFDPFFKHWYSRLIIPRQSFFVLSQHFFAQRPTLFLEKWKVCKGDLPVEFWIAYWSEQLWQASLFVLRARSQGIGEAKKQAYRLPFSFINKDWQRYTVKGLSQTYTNLSIIGGGIYDGNAGVWRRSVFGIDWIGMNVEEILEDDLGVDIFTDDAVGASICYRYVDGVLTSEPLWPWPMQDRIAAATERSLWDTADVNAEIEAVFGPIPEECKKY